MRRTYQEGYLSKRLMVFTDHRASFYCSTMSCMEGFGKLSPPATKGPKSELSSVSTLSDSWVHVEHGPNYTLFDSWGYGKPYRLQDWDYFCQMIHIYTKRHLTNEADALNAFRGVMHDMRRRRPPAFALSGLPFFAPSGQNEGQALEKLLSCALMWLRTKNINWPIDQELKRRSIFPSWAWIGWQGPVHYERSAFLGTIRRCYIRQLKLQSCAGEVIELSALWEAASPRTIQRALDTIDVLAFVAPTIPAEHITRADFGKKADEHWESETFRFFGCKLASTEPEPAVFSKLIENVSAGKWSCLLLCCTEGEDWTTGYVLVVQWHPDQVTAERIGAFGFLGVDPDSQEALLEWRPVKLI
jgi:hypothetical protein